MKRSVTLTVTITEADSRSHRRLATATLGWSGEALIGVLQGMYQQFSQQRKGITRALQHDLDLKGSDTPPNYLKSAAEKLASLNANQAEVLSLIEEITGPLSETELAEMFPEDRS